jgi:transketolase
MEFPRTRDTAVLKDKARILRRRIIEMLAAAGSGHPGGALSAADIIAALYYAEMRHDPANPKWPERDRFILSKGHANAVLYAVLAETGYFPVTALPTLRKLGSILQGHPDMKKTPGVEISSGSLGQGFSAAGGLAAGLKLDKKTARVYVLLGDGESAEGQVWEAALAASHYKLDNLCAILDHNGLQIDGKTCDVMCTDPMPDKWQAFGWNVINADGHDFTSILSALDQARTVKGKPTMIVAKTIKGRGVSFMEHGVDWHGKAPSAQEAEKALAELGGPSHG